jgi:hypothetical protein
MDAFSYLSVLLSIILGLAITQILQGVRGLMLARSRLQVYGPSLWWTGILLVIDVQAWWAMYDLRARVEWSFLDFAVVLAQTIPMYLLAGLVLPDVATEGPVDLRRHYLDNHRWFFVLLIVTLLVSIARPLVLTGALPSPPDLAFHLAFIVMALAAACVSSEIFHRWIAPVSGVAIALYIGLLFAHLR